jgi:hypothetical protein
MALDEQVRDIPRVWEVDWAVPSDEEGAPWAAYPWLLDMAADLGATEVSIVAGTYQSLGRLDLAIGGTEASRLRVLPHQYRIGGITVHGIPRRGSWYARGPVLVAWADDQILSEIEAQRPTAIAAVAGWPDDIATWRSLYRPQRVGQARRDQEAEFDTASDPVLDPRAVDAIRSAAALVNENHSVLSTHEREWVAGALVALRAAGIPIAEDALRAQLMAAGWNGKLIAQVLQLAGRIERGQTPRHKNFPL